jgi:hypothetical protein
MEEKDRTDEHDATEADNNPEEAAAKPGLRKQDPDQDETDSTTFDTDQHSDAPGPFGTG